MEMYADETTVVDESECWTRLRSSEVGRLAVVTPDGPDIFPVNYVVDHGTVVFRTAPGSKLTALRQGEPVAFEADGFDGDANEAWSVVVKGHPQQLRQPEAVLDAAGLPLFPWHGADKPVFVRVVPSHVSGRRFRVVEAARWPTTDLAPRAAPE